MTKTKSKSKDAWADLIVAILSVNSYSLEKTYAILHALRLEGLTDPLNLSLWGFEEVSRRLEKSGYRRGEYINMLIVARLCKLGEFVQREGFEKCTLLLESTNQEVIKRLLSKVYGVGPTVLRNFMILREIDPPSGK